MIISSSWDVVTFSVVLTLFSQWFLLSDSADAPTPIEAHMAKAVYLNCPCNLSEVHFVEWKHDAKRIMIHDHSEVVKTEKGYRSRCLSENSIYQLEIYLNETKDFGSYICLQYKSSGKPEKMAWILQPEVESASAINELTATVGETISLECSSNGNYLTSVDWKRNGASVIKHHADYIGELNDGRYTSRVFQSNSTARLEIFDLSKKDDGNYSCGLSQRSGRHIETSWKLHIKDNGVDTTTAFLGTSVTFTCTVDSPKSTLVAILWYHESKQILTHHKNVKIETNGRYTSTIVDDYGNRSTALLKIPWVGHDDSGMYSCAPYLTTGNRERMHWNLNVKGDQRKEMTKLVSLDDYTELDCSSDLPDVAAFQWTRRPIGQVSQNKLITRNYNENGENNISSLQIFHAKFEDAGKYSCFSFSKNNKTQETSWTLQIQGYPQLTATANAFQENDTVNSKCCVKFGLVPVTSNKIEWLMNGREHTFDKHYENATEASVNSSICGSLQFPVTRAYHGQSLDCWIQNELNRTSSLTLSVFYPPEILQIEYYPSENIFPVTINVYVICSVDAHPEPSVKLEEKSTSEVHDKMSLQPPLQYKNGTISKWKFYLSVHDKHSYRCVASNKYGTITSDYIEIDCVLSCIFIGIKGLVLIIVLMTFGVIAFIVIILKAASRLKGTYSRYNVHTDSSRIPVQTKTTRSAIYENHSGYKSSPADNPRIFASDGKENKTVGDENYSLVTSRKGGQTEIKSEENIKRKPTPRRKPKHRSNQRTTSSRKKSANQSSAGVINNENVLYATVNKEKQSASTNALYATVYEEKSSSAEAQSETPSNGTSDNLKRLTSSETMYAKVKKTRIWRS